jgi:hypothetical protein
MLGPPQAKTLGTFPAERNTMNEQLLAMLQELERAQQATASQISQFENEAGELKATRRPDVLRFGECLVQASSLRRR